MIPNTPILPSFPCPQNRAPFQTSSFFLLCLGIFMFCMLLAKSTVSFHIFWKFHFLFFSCFIFFYQQFSYFNWKFCSVIGFVRAINLQVCPNKLLHILLKAYLF